MSHSDFQVSLMMFVFTLAKILIWIEIFWTEIKALTLSGCMTFTFFALEPCVVTCCCVWDCSLAQNRKSIIIYKFT